jgi:hypothetical protein
MMTFTKNLFDLIAPGPTAIVHLSTGTVHIRTLSVTAGFILLCAIRNCVAGTVVEPELQ